MTREQLTAEKESIEKELAANAEQRKILRKYLRSVTTLLNGKPVPAAEPEKPA